MNIFYRFDSSTPKGRLFLAFAEERLDNRFPGAKGLICAASSDSFPRFDAAHGDQKGSPVRVRYSLFSNKDKSASITIYVDRASLPKPKHVALLVQHADHPMQHMITRVAEALYQMRTGATITEPQVFLSPEDDQFYSNMNDLRPQQMQALLQEGYQEILANPGRPLMLFFDKHKNRLFVL